MISLQNKHAFLQRAAILLTVFSAYSQFTKAQAVVDASNWDNKIMAGYQGWFRNPGDNPKDTRQGWSHLFGGRSENGVMRPGFDMWPDMSEYAADEKTAVPGYTLPDGSQAYLYSAQNAKAVLRHFQWMKEYGIDGVWLSEFCDHFPLGRQAYDSTTVYTIMHNVQAAAKVTGRTWAFMWDMSGFGPRNSKKEVYDVIITNWKRMVDEGVTASTSRYMHHNGLPVLQIWGFFPERPASQPAYMDSVINFLQKPGKYQAAIVSGVDDKWRAKGTPEFQAMLMRMPALQPWSVGRRFFDPITGYHVSDDSKWADDIAKCKANGVVFMPTINAGTNIAGPPPVPPKGPTIPRRTGNYLWQQFIDAQQTGVITSAFICMFDEINEGTQIMKTTNHPPTQYPFLTFDGATSDYYLRLLGTASKMLKNHTPFSTVIPISPFDAKKWYKIKNREGGQLLTNLSKTEKSAITATTDATDINDDWQLLYDGKGYFKIKSRLSGKLLAGAGDAVAQAADGKGDNLMWHMEWDGSGGCRIINKASGKALTANSTGLAQVENAGKLGDLHSNNELRWLVIEPM